MPIWKFMSSKGNIKGLVFAKKAWRPGMETPYFYVYFDFL